MEFKILTSQLLDDFTKKVNESPLDKLDSMLNFKCLTTKVAKENTKDTQRISLTKRH